MTIMFDPQYLRPDDVGTQRNKRLILAPADSVQEVEAVAYRPRDRTRSEVVPAVVHERRKADLRDRRHHERRQQNRACLLDTRTNRERRSQLRRQEDLLPSATADASNRVRLGVDEVI